MRLIYKDVRVTLRLSFKGQKDKEHIFKQKE
jgi:hypothetical protein